LENNFTLLIN